MLLFLFFLWNVLPRATFWSWLILPQGLVQNFGVLILFNIFHMWHWITYFLLVLSTMSVCVCSDYLAALKCTDLCQSERPLCLILPFYHLVITMNYHIIMHKTKSKISVVEMKFEETYVQILQEILWKVYLCKPFTLQCSTYYKIIRYSYFIFICNILDLDFEGVTKNLKVLNLISSV